MDDKFENVEIINGEEIVTLYDDQNNGIDFYEIAVVEKDAEFYALLQPVEEMEGIEEGDVLIFQVIEGEDGEETFKSVEDEALMNAVFDDFMRAAASHGCGCGCEDCEGECHHHDEDEE